MQITANSCTLKISTLTNSDHIQQREGLNSETLAQYIETALNATADGQPWPFPPVVVFMDSNGGYWLADGFHRIDAAIEVGIEAIPADIRAGSEFDALLFACSANATHGLRRTSADKRKAVTTLVNNPACKDWSNRRIAKACNVSDVFVAKVKEKLPAQVQTFARDEIMINSPPSPRIGVDGKRYPNSTRSNQVQTFACDEKMISTPIHTRTSGQPPAHELEPLVNRLVGAVHDVTAQTFTIEQQDRVWQCTTRLIRWGVDSLEGGKWEGRWLALTILIKEQITPSRLAAASSEFVNAVEDLIDLVQTSLDVLTAGKCLAHENTGGHA